MRRDPLEKAADRHTSRTSVPDPISDETRVTVRARSGGWCECCRSARATHMHHRQLRRFGDHTAGNLLHICAACHTWIHRNRRAVEPRGWLIPGHVTDPGSLPALLLRPDRCDPDEPPRWVRLDGASYVPLTTEPEAIP